MALAPLSVASVSPSFYSLSLFVLSSILSVCALRLAYAMLAPFCLIETSSLLSSLFISPLVAFSLFFSHSTSLYSCFFLAPLYAFLCLAFYFSSFRARKEEGVSYCPMILVS